MKVKFQVENEKLSVSLDRGIVTRYPYHINKEVDIMTTLKDKVRCNMCMWVGFVNRDEDTCPNCCETGYLMDIEQDIEV